MRLDDRNSFDSSSRPDDNRTASRPEQLSSPQSISDCSESYPLADAKMSSTPHKRSKLRCVGAPEELEEFCPTDELPPECALDPMLEELAQQLVSDSQHLSRLYPAETPSTESAVAGTSCLHKPAGEEFSHGFRLGSSHRADWHRTQTNKLIRGVALASLLVVVVAWTLRGDSGGIDRPLVRADRVTDLTEVADQEIINNSRTAALPDTKAEQVSSGLTVSGLLSEAAEARTESFRATNRSNAPSNETREVNASAGLLATPMGVDSVAEDVDEIPRSQRLQAHSGRSPNTNVLAAEADEGRAARISEDMQTRQTDDLVRLVLHAAPASHSTTLATRVESTLIYYTTQPEMEGWLDVVKPTPDRKVRIDF